MDDQRRWRFESTTTTKSIANHHHRSWAMLMLCCLCCKSACHLPTQNWRVHCFSRIEYSPPKKQLIETETTMHDDNDDTRRLGLLGAFYFWHSFLYPILGLSCLGINTKQPCVVGSSTRSSTSSNRSRGGVAGSSIGSSHRSGSQTKTNQEVII